MANRVAEKPSTGISFQEVKSTEVVTFANPPPALASDTHKDAECHLGSLCLWFFKYYFFSGCSPLLLLIVILLSGSQGFQHLWRQRTGALGNPAGPIFKATFARSPSEKENTPPLLHMNITCIYIPLHRLQPGTPACIPSPRWAAGVWHVPQEFGMSSGDHKEQLPNFSVIHKQEKLMCTMLSQRESSSMDTYGGIPLFNHTLEAVTLKADFENKNLLPGLKQHGKRYSSLLFLSILLVDKNAGVGLWTAPIKRYIHHLLLFLLHSNSCELHA